jgi:hypothetical protein
MRSRPKLLVLCNIFAQLFPAFFLLGEKFFTAVDEFKDNFLLSSSANALDMKPPMPTPFPVPFLQHK